MGFGDLPCIKCGEEEAVITCRLDSFDEADTFRCASCEAEYSRADIGRTIAVWAKVLAWLETCPVVK